MSTLKATFYDTLGIQKDAPTDEIRKAYRKRALETHPDKLDPGASEEERQATERQFHKVNDAFQTLGDPQKRRRYDAILALRTDPALISDASARRTADRQEWARQQREMIQRRINAFKDEEALRKRQENLKKEQENLRKEQEKLKKEEDMKEEAKRKEEAKERKVADVLQELRNATPELTARREALLKRKAERERLDAERARQPPSPIAVPQLKSPSLAMRSPIATPQAKSPPLPMSPTTIPLPKSPSLSSLSSVDMQSPRSPAGPRRPKTPSELSYPKSPLSASQPSPPGSPIIR